MPWEQNIHAGDRALGSGLNEQAYQRFTQAIEEGKAFAIGDSTWGDAHRGLTRACLALGRFDEACAAALVALETDEMFWGPEHPTVAEDSYLAGEAFRCAEKFESAKSHYERALNYWTQQYGEQNEGALQALAALLLLYLQSKRETGFAQMHARVFAAYQTAFPTGMWLQFVRLKETLDRLVHGGEVDRAGEILAREISIMTSTLGRNHKELKPLLEYQSQILRDSKKYMAAWRITTQIGKKQDEGLFFSDTRTYNLASEQVITIMSNLLASRGSFLPASAPKILRQCWWQITKSDPLGHRLQACLPLSIVGDVGAGFADAPKRGRIELEIKCNIDGSTTNCEFAWHLLESHNSAACREIRRFTLEEFDQTFLIVPGLRSRHIVSAEDVQREAARSWPTPQMYNEAIQDPSRCFVDAELQSASAVLNAIGLPRPLSGAFATVYRLSSQERHWAVKCFTEAVTDQPRRYQKIAAAVQKLHLPFFTQFDFEENGIRVQTEIYPIVKMSWAEGSALNVAIETHLHDASMLGKISSAFLHIAGEMERHSIAHGDLQHGNILVGANGLMLVDYDNMFVPDLSGWHSNEIGHRNYQHPARTGQHFGPYIDNFSVWVIYVSLFILARQPHLWDEFECGDECLLFRHSDFVHPSESKVFNTLARHSDTNIHAPAATLSEFLALTPEKVPSVASYFSKNKAH